MFRWISYLAKERSDKLNRMHMLSSGWARLHMTSEGITRDITDEQLEELQEDVAEIERILLEAGCDIPDGKGGWLDPTEPPVT